jgi:hypothetical protein
MAQNPMEAADIAPCAPASHVGPGLHSSRRYYLYLAVLGFALAALTLSACGGSGSTNPPASRPSTTLGSPSTPTSKPSVALPSTTTPTPEAPTTVPPVTTPTTEAPTTVPPSTTPTTEAPTTAPPTTEAPTTAPPTTEAPTTVPPSTTPTTEAPTTAPLSTTPSAEAATSSTPWGWIVAGILVVVGLVVALVLLLRSRSRRAALTAWRQSARPALEQAAVARDLISGDGTNVDPERREDVRTQIEAAAQALDGLVTSAPDDASRRAASSSAAALRGLMFADEADRLLRSRDDSPTGDELAQADQAQRARLRELDVALDELATQARPEEGTEPPPDRIQ